MKESYPPPVKKTTFWMAGRFGSGCVFLGGHPESVDLDSDVCFWMAINDIAINNLEMQDDLDSDVEDKGESLGGSRNLHGANTLSMLCVPYTLIPQPSTLNPQHSTLNTQHSTLNAEP